MTLYATLGVQPTASPDEIKKAYRKLAQQHHPDKQGADADRTKFQEIQEAYDVLSDPERRDRYDRDGTYRHMKEPTEEEKINAAAQNGLRQVLSQIIDGTEYVEYTDIFENLQKEAESIRANMTKERDGLIKRREKLELAVKRIKPKEEGQENIGALLMQSVIMEVQGLIGRADFALKIAERLVEIVGGHTYEVDQMPEELRNKKRQQEANELAQMIAQQMHQQFGRFR
jgi:curved DNA-binding protein CbpA